MPKQHIPYLEDLGEETGASMFRAAHRLARALRRSGLRCEGVNLFLADGEAAFQEVFHTHLHVFPRYGGDSFRIDGGWINVRTSDGQQIGFQPAPNYALPQWPGQEHPQQFHLDLFVEGREAAAERAVSLGAARLATGPTWITLTDPAGHPFDLCEKDGIGTAVQLFAVTIDAPTRRHWLTSIPIYSDLLGMELTYEGPGGGADRRRQEFDVPADQRLQRAPLAGPGAPAAGPPGHHSRRSRRRRGTSPGVGRNAGSAAAGSSSEPSPIRPATRSTSPGSSPGEVGNERP